MKKKKKEKKMDFSSRKLTTAPPLTPITKIPAPRRVFFPRLAVPRVKMA